jgi:glycosyltransferase involved in cell wall biosynthesis/predicted nucleic acid-binding protein
VTVTTAGTVATVGTVGAQALGEWGGAGLAAAGTAGPLVEVVLPVYNEERVLAASVTRLHDYLSGGFPFAFRITVADNASTDATWFVARQLAARLPRVRAVHLDERGRGRALRHVWSRSDADVVAYMDVDLSTGLEAFLPLVAPLLTGHSDLAIGTRLAHGAAVLRGPRRELISRCYNLLLRTLLGARFSDAQCGFKAGRTEVVRALLPAVEDQAWFFDTELLLLAERSGLRIHEVPVDWVDDPDSRVEVLRTAIDDLRGMARVARRIAKGTTRVPIPNRVRNPSLAAGRRQRVLHRASLALLESHPGPLLVPALVVTEVAYLIGARLGANAEVRFLGDLAAGAFTVEPVHPSDWLRIGELVHRYRDLPLGTVDASVVATAERLSVTELATVDRRHFTVVRALHTAAFRLLP